MPKFQDSEVKDLFRVAPGAYVVGEHLLDSAFLEIAAGRGPGVEKKVVNPVLEIPAKSFFIRHGDASFFSIEDFARDAAAKSFLGDVLGGEAVDFEVLRQRGCKFENFVVEQRH